MPPLVLRAPAPHERGPARVHVGEWSAATRSHARMLEILDDALDAPGDEGEALAAFEGATLRGVVVFGFVAGAHGMGRLTLLAADAAEVAQALAAEATRALAARGARMVIAEWGDEPPHAQPAAWLRASGWAEAGRIADLVADGVDAVVLRRYATVTA